MIQYCNIKWLAPCLNFQQSLKSGIKSALSLLITSLRPQTYPPPQWITDTLFRRWRKQQRQGDNILALTDEEGVPTSSQGQEAVCYHAYDCPIFANATSY
jgi:hypothetical protein